MPQNKILKKLLNFLSHNFHLIPLRKSDRIMRYDTEILKKSHNWEI